MYNLVIFRVCLKEKQGNFCLAVFWLNIFIKIYGFYFCFQLLMSFSMLFFQIIFPIYFAKSLFQVIFQSYYSKSFFQVIFPSHYSKLFFQVIFSSQFSKSFSQVISAGHFFKSVLQANYSVLKARRLVRIYPTEISTVKMLFYHIFVSFVFLR